MLIIRLHFSHPEAGILFLSWLLVVLEFGGISRVFIEDIQGVNRTALLKIPTSFQDFGLKMRRTTSILLLGARACSLSPCHGQITVVK